MATKQNFLKKILSHLFVLGLRGLAVLIRLTPPVFWGALASALTPVFWFFCSAFRRNTLKNLVRTGHTLEEARSLGKQSFRSILLTILESLAMERLLSRKGVRVETRMSPEAEELLQKIRSGDVAVSFALSGHIGVWEFLGAELARLCAPTHVFVTAKVVKNPVMEDFTVRLRQSSGFKVVSVPSSLRHFLNEIRTGPPSVYAFLCDQHYEGGIRVPFMGKTSCCSTVPANLILKYGWPVLIGRCIRRVPGDYLIEVDILDLSPYMKLPKDEALRGIIMATNDYIGESIAKAPGQWLWGHKRWRNCCGPDAKIKEWPAGLRRAKKKKRAACSPASH